MRWVAREVGSQFGSSGYVVDSVPLALYAARSIDRVPFDLLLRNIIEAGGDTDTIASMTGQIAGAWLGAPQSLGSFSNADEIEKTVNEFAATV